MLIINLCSKKTRVNYERRDITLEFLFKGIVPYDELIWKKI